MNIKKIYRSFLKHFRPYEYMDKVGINFPRGGGTYLWKSFMEY